MIQLITGVPGSGKTCLCLKLLTEKYYNYDSKHDYFYLKPENQNITLITNIDSLTLPHLNLNSLFQQHGLTFESFFNYDYQKKVSKKYSRIIYILDEAQQFLNRKLLNTLYFDMHRHLDHQIYLITQDFKKIHYDITSLIEFEYRLTKRTFSIMGEFRYLVKSSGTVFETRSFRPPKNIFKLYKSFISNTNQPKRKNPILKYITVPFFLFLISGFYFYSVLIPDSEAKNQNQQKDVQIQKSVLQTEKNQIIEQKNKIPILNKIIVGSKIKIFQCPFTGKFFSPEQYQFPIYRNKKDIYLFLTHQQIEQFLNNEQTTKKYFYTPQRIPDQNPGQNSDQNSGPGQNSNQNSGQTPSVHQIPVTNQNPGLERYMKIS